MQDLKIIQRYRRKGLPRTVGVELIETAETCGIMFEPVNEVEVQGLPTVLDLERPDCCGAKLACGHVFATASILYHWARSRTVKCPLCRQGPSGRLNVRALPPHFRTPLTHKINDANKSDRREQIRSDRNYALQLLSLEQPHCDVVFEAYDGRVLRLRVHSATTIFVVRELEAVREFLRTVYRYRLSVVSDNTSFPVTPWVRFDMSWVWAGPVCYSVHVAHGSVESVVIII